jgi:hypothetical protein
MWSVLEDTVVIGGTRQLVSNAIKIYTKSVFDAIADNDPSELLFYAIEQQK